MLEKNILHLHWYNVLKIIVFDNTLYILLFFSPIFDFRIQFWRNCWTAQTVIYNEIIIRNSKFLIYCLVWQLLTTSWSVNMFSQKLLKVVQQNLEGVKVLVVE